MWAPRAHIGLDIYRVHQWYGGALATAIILPSIGLLLIDIHRQLAPIAMALHRYGYGSANGIRHEEPHKTPSSFDVFDTLIIYDFPFARCAPLVCHLFAQAARNWASDETCVQCLLFGYYTRDTPAIFVRYY